jgi:hypothetical protein
LIYDLGEHCLTGKRGIVEESNIKKLSLRESEEENVKRLRASTQTARNTLLNLDKEDKIEKLTKFFGAPQAVVQRGLVSKENQRKPN